MLSRREFEQVMAAFTSMPAAKAADGVLYLPSIVVFKLLATFCSYKPQIEEDSEEGSDGLVIMWPLEVKAAADREKKLTTLEHGHLLDGKQVEDNVLAALWRVEDLVPGVLRQKFEGLVNDIEHELAECDVSARYEEKNL
jgi:hypothetical protein